MWNRSYCTNCFLHISPKQEDYHSSENRMKIWGALGSIFAQAKIGVLSRDSSRKRYLDSPNIMKNIDEIIQMVRVEEGHLNW